MRATNTRSIAPGSMSGERERIGKLRLWQLRVRQSRPLRGSLSLAYIGMTIVLTAPIATMIQGQNADVRSGRVLSVGPGLMFPTPSKAAAMARDGDVVEIHAAIYSGDVAVWRANHLTLRGVGGRPHLKADGASAQGKAIWVIQGQNTIVENIEFSGAKVPDGNGAAIRQEGVGLIVRECYIHDNEMGILAGN